MKSNDYSGEADAKVFGKGNITSIETHVPGARGRNAFTQSSFP
jgi:hypothetical protein